MKRNSLSFNVKSILKKIVVYCNIFPHITLGFLKSTIFKNIAVLFSSSTLAQLLPVAISPIIARLYNPRDYALSAAFSSMTIITTVMSTGMYDVAIMIDKDDDEAVNTAAASFIFSLAFTMLAIVIILTLANPITHATNNKDIAHYLWLIPISILSTGLFKILSMWTNRKSRFSRISLNRIYMAILTSVSLLIFGYYGLGGRGLIFSVILCQVIITVILLIQTVNDDYNIYKSISLNKIKSSFNLHRHFLFFNLPQAFLDGFRESSIILIISNCFGSVVLGSFTFAYNILAKLSRFSGDSISQVFYQRASERYNTNKSNKEVIRVTSMTLTAISFPVFSIIAIWGHNIFQFVFGEVWIQSGYIAQILALLFFLRFIVSPIATTPIIYNRQKQYLIVSCIYNIVPPLSMYAASLLFKTSIYYPIIAFVLTGSISLMIILYWFRQLSKISK